MSGSSTLHPKRDSQVVVMRLAWFAFPRVQITCRTVLNSRIYRHEFYGIGLGDLKIMVK